VSSQSAATGQLFAYTPSIITNALNLTADEVRTYALKAFAPASYQGDITQLGTLFLAYIPKDTVNELAAQLPARNSAFYTASTGLPYDLAQLVDGTFPLLYVSGGSSGSSSPGSPSGASGSNGNSRRNAIIGVCVAFGALGLIVVGWWIARVIRRKREAGHTRLVGGGGGGTADYFASYGATAPSMQQAAPSSNLGVHGGIEERRRSFFFAEDELRGYDDGLRQEETTYVSRQSSGRRGPIKPGAISAPILRESSLNW